MPLYHCGRHLDERQRAMVAARIANMRHDGQLEHFTGREMDGNDDVLHVAQVMIDHHGMAAEANIDATISEIVARGGSANLNWSRDVLECVRALRKLDDALSANLDQISLDQPRPRV